MSSCCKLPWIIGSVETPAGQVPRVATELSFSDKRSAVAVRLNIGRLSYVIPPGLYAVGKPTATSHVFVSANYKLSFDTLRKELTGIDGWILVLDTKGINVWCASGKETFGTQEIITRIGETRLDKVVAHRRLIVPQLGAPGVAAHIVNKRTGFRVIYGPAHARDIPAFLAENLKTTPAMRRVQFDIVERLKVTPVEITLWFRYIALLAFVMLIISGIGPDGYQAAEVLAAVPRVFLYLFSALLLGSVITPALLPAIPGRAFAVKGAWVGMVFLVASALAAPPPGTLSARLEIAAWACLVITTSSFLAMNFTGTSTYTSLSGVSKEMRIAVPLQILGLIAGLSLWVAVQYCDP